jgi:hypothetical protein
VLVPLSLRQLQRCFHSGILCSCTEQQHNSAG